jgi:hypothetical protein
MNKHIGISGTNNRYQMKKVLGLTQSPLQDTVYIESQLSLLEDEHVLHDIVVKLRGYLQQDKLRGRQNNLVLEHVIETMKACELKCRYCSIDMLVQYETKREKREMRQWTIDRVDNDIGHIIENYHLACLECNLKRRRTSDTAFLFTKQLLVTKL